VYRKGAFAAAALDEELGASAGLLPADRGLATEIVYGVLRTRGVLEASLLQFAKSGIAGGDQHVLMHLLVAAYQLYFLDRVPEFAIVNEAVSLVSAERGSRVGGFCNALLRRLAKTEKPKLSRALRESAPAWLVDELVASVGDVAADHLLGIASGDEVRSATPCVRLVGDVPVPAWLSDTPRGALYDQAYRVGNAGNLRRHPEYAEGHFVIQDEGAMFIAHALGVQPDQRVLDACAGRGQKASLLAERLSGRGELWVDDKTLKKLDQLNAEFRRLGLPLPETRVVDWGNDEPDMPSDFDVALVDAPCSGTGTLRRRPEIMLRLTSSDVARLAELATTILRAAAHRVRPGGRVMFVVCSVLRQECEAVIEAVADQLELVPFEVDHPALYGKTMLRLLPSVHGTDGFFLANLRRR
jgi:16S rRNA (cytosine967-C5)-methyltransferase